MWPTTIFYEDEENMDTDFRSLKKKGKKIELLDYDKSRGQEIAEYDAFEVLQGDDKTTTVCQLTDAEICSMVLMNSKTSVSDSEEEIQAEDKMSIGSLVELLNTTIKRPEQREFISESDITAIHKIKETLLNQKPKLMKQLTLNKIFCKNVKIIMK
ncbi:hypothetical protein AVEN_149219-1 [Araneus ventricosus]|uniref:Uncharacterized protein n=1 Tax=Araneus ventricosus TaxID=182803 RepID=A0A4Y2LP30_ARAVE|nr:hypothetical protein AVEN_149219-1 [Araneus ventricosus]